MDSRHPLACHLEVSDGVIGLLDARDNAVSRRAHHRSTSLRTRARSYFREFRSPILNAFADLARAIRSFIPKENSQLVDDDRLARHDIRCTRVIGEYQVRTDAKSNRVFAKLSFSFLLGSFARGAIERNCVLQLYDRLG